MTNEIKYTIHFNQEQKQKQYISCKFSLHNPANDELLWGGESPRGTKAEAKFPLVPICADWSIADL